MEVILPEVKPDIDTLGSVSEASTHRTSPRPPESSKTVVFTNNNSKFTSSGSTPPSVIQSPSVITSATGQIQVSKGNVILLANKPPSVIQTTSGALGGGANPHSDESGLSNDGVDLPPGLTRTGSQDRRRREILTRRPSYRKILNDLGGAELGGDKGASSTSDSSQEALDHGYSGSVVKVLNSNLGLSGSGEGGSPSLQTIMTNAGTAGGTIVQYTHTQDGQQFFVPVGNELQAYTIRPVSSSSSSPSGVVMHGGGGSGHHPPEEQTRKREIRLLKNREAARECRRKKKEYIKCLENRVAVLENQNKALIDELKSLKELYCQQKTD